MVCGLLRYLVRVEKGSNLSVISRVTKCVGTIHEIDIIPRYCYLVTNCVTPVTHFVTGCKMYYNGPAFCYPFNAFSYRVW